MKLKFLRSYLSLNHLLKSSFFFDLNNRISSASISSIWTPTSDLVISGVFLRLNFFMREYLYMAKNAYNFWYFKDFPRRPKCIYFFCFPCQLLCTTLSNIILSLLFIHLPNASCKYFFLLFLTFSRNILVIYLNFCT